MSVPRPRLVPPPDVLVDEEWLEDARAVDYSRSRDAGLSSDEDSGVDDNPRSPPVVRRGRKNKCPFFGFMNARKKT